MKLRLKAPLKSEVSEPIVGDNLTIDDYKDTFDAAGIPYRYRRMKLESQGAAGETIRQYLDVENGQFLNDKRDKRGLVMIGEASVRNNLFPMLARGAALRQDSLYYIQLSDLADALMEPGDSNKTLDRCFHRPALFIEDFYDSNTECRYDRKELRRIEALLRDRLNNERRVYLSTSRGVHLMEWYSTGLRDLIQETTRSIGV